MQNTQSEHSENVSRSGVRAATSGLAVLMALLGLAACSDDPPAAAGDRQSATSEVTITPTSSIGTVAPVDTEPASRAATTGATRSSVATPASVAVEAATATSGAPNADVPDGSPATTAPPAEPIAAPAADAAPSTGIADAISITVPPVPVQVVPAVGVDAIADFGDGVTVRIVGHEAVEVTTVLPGEIGGPALAVDLEFANRSGEPIDLSTVIVDLQFGEAIPANPVTSDPAEPVTGTLAPGATATGRYVFNVPTEARADVQLFVTYSADAPTIQIDGSLAP